MVLQVLFWILLVLCALGYFAPLEPRYATGRGIITLILIGILGWVVFNGIR